MSATLTVNLARPIRSVAILGPGVGTLPDAAPGAGRAGSASHAAQPLQQELEAQKAVLSNVNLALESVVGKLNEFFDKAFAAHKNEIARLSVEIARKILAQRVDNGDYEIEAIVKEALDNAPVRQDVVVHLNPEDLSQFRKLQQDEPGKELAGIKFVPDTSVGRAECLLETPKGIVESMIEQHLEEVTKALMKVK